LKRPMSMAIHIFLRYYITHPSVSRIDPSKAKKWLTIYSPFPWF
jgi:hypothetical protein